MSDIAAIYHWPLGEIAALPLPDLIHWRALAVDSWNRMWARKEGEA